MGTLITTKRCQSEVRISFASECAGTALLASVAGRMGVGQNGKKCICSYIRARAKAPCHYWIVKNVLTGLRIYWDRNPMQISNRSSEIPRSGIHNIFNKDPSKCGWVVMNMALLEKKDNNSVLFNVQESDRCNRTGIRTYHSLRK